MAQGQSIYGSRALPAYSLLSAARAAGANVDYTILVNGLEDDEAFAAEHLIIASYPTGQLWNVQAGGRGDTGGRRLRSIWADPVLAGRLAEKIRLGHLEDRYRDAARQKALAQWADPKFRARWLQQHRSSWGDSETSAIRRARLKEQWANKTEAKEKVRQAVRLAWTPERRASMAENRRRAWADPEFKKRVTEKARATKNAKSRQGLFVYPAGPEQV